MTAFSAYLLDRKYTRSVSPKTLSWYDDVWRAFGPFLDLDNIRGSLRTGTQQEGDGLFFTSKGTHITPRNYQRDLKALGVAAGITGVRFSPHTLRHSFSVGYRRKGGNLEYLRRILGHSQISTTQRYLKSLGIEDLQAVHSGLSLLSR